MSVKYLILNLLFPPKCAACGEVLDIDITKRHTSPLCARCRRVYELAKTEECAECGLSAEHCRCMPKNMAREGCSSLLKLAFYRPGDPSSRMGRFILSVKEINDPVLFSFLAEQLRGLLIGEMRREGLMPGDCFITYMPRSHAKLRDVGFDQGLLLARALSQITGIELVDCFLRDRASTEQKNLDEAERRANMREAYSAREIGERVRGKVAVVVDDIVTSGASMSAAARILHSLGARGVIGICIGRTDSKK